MRVCLVSSGKQHSTIQHTAQEKRCSATSRNLQARRCVSRIIAGHEAVLCSPRQHLISSGRARDDAKTAGAAQELAGWLAGTGAALIRYGTMMYGTGTGSIIDRSANCWSRHKLKHKQHACLTSVISSVDSG